MARKNQRKQKKKVSGPADHKEVDDMVVRQWAEAERPIRRTFAGPKGASSLLRVALSKDALAELSLHARESLEVEVCGVLVGDICEDDSGLFVDVCAVIRGASSEKGSRHVTFTQETWNDIHTTLQSKYPKLSIVGWYHSHPGFGVEFSEMDAFVHQNFFPMPTQLALVVDPLGGDMAVCVNTKDGIQYLDRLWVEGKEKRLQGAPTQAPEGGAESASQTDERLETMETRLSQVMHALDDQRAAMDRVLMTLGVIACLVVVFLIGGSIYSHFTTRWSPPEKHKYVRMPVLMGDKTVYLGVQVVSLEIPPELHAIQIELAKEREEALLRAQQELLKQAEEELGREAAEESKQNPVPWWKRLFGDGKSKEKSLPEQEEGNS